MKKFLFILILGQVLIHCGCSTQPPTSNVVTITSASWTATPTEAQLIQSLVDEFEKLHPHIKVKYDIITRDYGSKILTQLAGGNAPESFWADMGFVRPLVNKKVIADLTPYIIADNVDTSDFFPALLEPFVIDGHYYGLPNDATSLAMFFNQDLFDKAGVKYPDENWKWNDLLKTAQKLTKDINHDGQTDQWGLFLLNRPDNWFPFIYQNGGQVFNPQKPDELFLTDSRALEAIQFYVDLTLKYHVAPSHGQSMDMDLLQGFRLGKVAMIIGGWWDIPDIAKHAPNLRYGVVPLPGNKVRATENFATATVMDKNAKHPKETWEFIKFMTGKEGQLIRCKSGMAGPSRKSVAADPFFKDKPREKVLIDGFPYGKGFYGNYPELIIDEFTRAYDRVILKQQTLQQAFQEATNNYEKRRKND